jgi:hypothetical protein
MYERVFIENDNQLVRYSIIDSPWRHAVECRCNDDSIEGHVTALIHEKNITREEYHTHTISSSKAPRLIWRGRGHDAARIT